MGQGYVKPVVAMAWTSAALAQSVATLLLPGEMGERFKVLALTRGIEAPLSGFAFRDLAATL